MLTETQWGPALSMAHNSRASPQLCLLGSEVERTSQA